MSTETTTTTPTRQARRSRHGPSSRGRRNPAPVVLGVLGAVVAGVGGALLTHSAFGVVGLFVPLIVGYLVFVAIVALAEFGRARFGDVVVVDLPAEHDADQPAQILEVVPDQPETSPDLDVPARHKRVDGANLTEIVVAAVGAAAFAELVRIVLRMQSTLGAFAWWYVAFIALYFVLARDRSDAESGLDSVVTVLVWSIGILVAAALTWMVVFIAVNGVKLLTGGFFTQDLSKTGPLTPGGGAKHAIIGTLQQVGIATVVVVPVGILTAVYLHEVRGRMATPIRFIVDAMSGLPSIVAGLLVFSVWVGSHGYSGIAGSAAIAILMIPTMTRASEEILRTAPDSLREGALALGAPHWRLVQRVVLPTAIAGLLTAMLLAIARAVGETAPMLLTAFGADNTNTNPLHGPQDDLPLFVWKLIRLPNVTQLDRAYTGALILVMLVFVFFAGARLAAARSQKRLGRAR